jgi:LemA protein
MFAGVVGLVVLVVLVYTVALYNSLVQVRNNVGKAFANIDVLLMQRHDELALLVEACKGYLKHEVDLLNQLTRLRVGYDEAGSSDEKVQLENRLNREVLKLRHTWEGYPDLKASQNFLQLQQRISTLESSIADRREFFNDTVNTFNIQIERFPALLVAPLLGYRRREFLEVPDEKKRDVELSFAT